MAVSRYNSGDTIQRNDGKRVYRSKIYSNIPKRDDDLYIVTQTGDRLDSISNEYYGDPSYWWIIASANNIHDATFSISDGTILRLPKNYNQISAQINN